MFAKICKYNQYTDSFSRKEPAGPFLVIKRIGVRFGGIFGQGMDKPQILEFLSKSNLISPSDLKSLKGLKTGGCAVGAAMVFFEKTTNGHSAKIGHHIETCFGWMYKYCIVDAV